MRNIYDEESVNGTVSDGYTELDNKFGLCDYPLMGIWYHFPFFWQLGRSFLAFHIGGNPLVACKVSCIDRAS